MTAGIPLPPRATGTPDLQVVALSQVPAQPWRNGGGVTRELLAWPQAAEWQVRVSVAEIEADGPFSAFPGVQRWFAVLQGAGVVLEQPGISRRLTPDSLPFEFDGAEAPGCRLIDGPTRDLNLMARHGAGRARMQRARPGETLPGSARWRGLFCQAPAVLVRGSGPHLAVPGMALAWSAARGQDWLLHSLEEPGAAWWLTLHDPGHPA